ncbi:hypothetical protein QQ045_015841 [Rhodiola kirilowii]
MSKLIYCFCSILCIIRSMEHIIAAYPNAQMLVAYFHCFGLRIDPKISRFQMSLHYPRFKKEDYEKMDEVSLKLLLGEYGLKFEGSLDQLREYAIGTFLWPDQL